MTRPSPDQTARHKYFLRLHYREVVRSLPLSIRQAGARSLARRVTDLAEFRRAPTVGIFLSLPYEVDTAPLIALARRAGKAVAVPVVSPEKSRMRFALLPRGHPRLVKNVYGILEPAKKEWVDPDLVIVPGAAFTQKGQRLGAGAGYYDRFLTENPRLKTVGVCFDEQIVVRLPRAPHDRRVGMVATPSRVYRFKQK